MRDPPSARRQQVRRRDTRHLEADKISGAAGNDVIDEGAGNDQIVGGLGNDQIAARPGNDVIDGGGGRDGIFAGPIRARDGVRDVIACGLGRDIVYADKLDSVARDCERVPRARD
jgi:Ca2+-binding RTX toxin-like protein